ncbi:hypothetical protein SLS56_011471 [Neofusicoccum ribis]|uniref:Glucose receptor Git3 N-terminal domain-containing protein n=1 Tax=Neofusicoccum ribis TaxID=45134 RepID=A0ABR3SBK0_9PEZI
MKSQAVDFSILAIAVVTFLTIQFKSYILYASMVKKVLICMAIWIVPLITSCTALGLDIYQPVSGNWCWISPKPRYLRYALTHGWRFAIIFFTICIYVYVFVYMHKRLRMRDTSGRSYSFDYGDDVNGFELNFRLPNNCPLGDQDAQNRDKDGDFPLPLTKAATGSTVNPKVPAVTKNPVIEDGEETLIERPPVSPPRMRIRQTASIDRDVWRMVLLNLYPITYVILWLPGISNRIVEATGGKSRALEIMQSSTQYTGLANACVYGFREHWEDIRFWWGQ